MERKVTICESRLFPVSEHVPQELIDQAEKELRRDLADYIQDNVVTYTRVAEHLDARVTTVTLKIPCGIDRYDFEDKLSKIYGTALRADGDVANDLKPYLRELWEEVFGMEVKPRWMT